MHKLAAEGIIEEVTYRSDNSRRKICIFAQRRF
jgi:hypothetical protein